MVERRERVNNFDQTYYNAMQSNCRYLQGKAYEKRLERFFSNVQEL